MAGRCARAVSLLVDYMNRTGEARDFITGWESAVQFELLGEEPFGVVFSKDGRATFEGKKLEIPDVIFYSDSETFFGMMTGKVDQDEAFSNGLVDVKGSIFDSVKFRHAAEITQQEHGTLFSILKAVSRFS